MQVSKTTPLLVWADERLRHQGSNRHLTSCVRRELPFPSFTQTSTSAPLPLLILSSIVILYCFIASLLDKVSPVPSDTPICSLHDQSMVSFVRISPSPRNQLTALDRPWNQVRSSRLIRVLRQTRSLTIFPPQHLLPRRSFVPGRILS